MASAELDVLTTDPDISEAPDPLGASETLRTIATILTAFATEMDTANPDSIGPGSNLTDYATNSVQMLQIHARLEDALGMEISASALFDHDTVAALAEHLDCRR